MKFEELKVSSDAPRKFGLPHIILALFYFKKKSPLGRYRLKEWLGIGEASTKTLMNHLSEKEHLFE